MINEKAREKFYASFLFQFMHLITGITNLMILVTILV